MGKNKAKKDLLRTAKEGQDIKQRTNMPKGTGGKSPQAPK